jgi:chaperonin cofactor prefoldin
VAHAYPEGDGPTVEELERRVGKLEGAIDRLQQMQKALEGKLDAIQHRVGLLDHRF